MGFLTGKTAIITGAGRAVLEDGSCGSIGYGIATAYAKEGANLVITGRNVKKLEAAKEELERLASKYKLLLLTDNWPDVFVSIKEYGISDLFSKIYVSSVYGQLKKDGDFFDNPIRDFNIKKNEAIFIDDNETLLEVASSKGFEVRLMDREGKLKNSKFKIINNLSSIL